ncbi:MAG: signal peptidase I [Janthinobacterium lividum]
MSAMSAEPGTPQAWERRLDTTSWWVRTLARVGLWMVFTLLMWSVLPMLVGWPARVVMSGSMLPLLTPGDVVVAHPLDDATVRAGQVIIFEDPSEPRTLVHRVFAVDGNIVTTKGDANPTPDSTPLEKTHIQGKVWLRIPLVGLPRLWIAHHDFRALGGAVAMITGLLIAAVDWRRPSDAPTATVSEAQPV